MLTWVLIIVFGCTGGLTGKSDGSSIVKIELFSKEGCQIAKRQVESYLGTQKAFCIQKR